MKDKGLIITNHRELAALTYDLTPSHVLVFLVARSFLNQCTTHGAIGAIAGFTHVHTCALMRDLSNRGLVSYERVGRKGVHIYRAGQY